LQVSVRLKIRKSGLATAICFENMRIRIDKNLCNGCETCINHCPDVFMMWGMYMKADFEVADPEKYQKAVQEAASLCPKKAVSISGQ
jgi:ferredoxin